MDIVENLNNSKIHQVNLEKKDFLPHPRENSSFIYDQVEQRLIMFGGWSDNFNNDLAQLNVIAITGPDYAIYDI